MSPRSEYYEALYETSHGEGALVRIEHVAAASFALCFLVFVAALVVAWRRSSERFAQAALLPFEASSKETP